MRQFLAVGLPQAVYRSAVELGRDLESRLDGWRWVPAGGVHLTLRFLGEVSEALDLRARPVWRRVARASRPFRLRLTEVGRFPERGGARVLWVGVRESAPGGTLGMLAEELERAAVALGWEAESRGFRPHLTLARRRRDTRHPVFEAPADPPAAEGAVTRLVLMQSRLGPGGARYTALESFPLGPATGEANDPEDPA